MPEGAQAARARLARKAGWMNLGQQHCCGRDHRPWRTRPPAVL